MKINTAGLNLLKSFEQCRLIAYQDSGGVWTIGWGHTGDDVYSGLVITQEQADALLAQDLAGCEAGVTRLLKRPVNANQFSAMVCFAYNVGLGNFKQSTLLNCVNKGQFGDAAKEFLRWNRVKGIISAGLTRRRQAESDLFQTDVPMGPN